MPLSLPTRSAIESIGSKAFRVAEMAATPLLPDDFLDLIDPLASKAELRGRIVSVVPETADAATLVIRPGRGWRSHVPGQYVRIGIDIDGVRHWRAYSVTSPPDRDDGCFTITVKAIEDGKVSNHLVHEVRAGVVIQLDQACGEFVIDPSASGKVLFLTAGSGITPIMGMLRSHALEDVVLVHSAPAPDDVIFARELRRLAELGKLTLIEQHTDRMGMLDGPGLERLVPDLSEREVWACGPTGMLDAVEEHLAGLGRDGHLHTERFRPTVIEPGEGGTVTFSQSETTVDADGATPILDVGEANGVLMPSGCRMGICFGCVVKLREGAVRDLRNGDLTTSTNGDEVPIQTCVSAAAGTCEIEI